MSYFTRVNSNKPKVANMANFTDSQIKQSFTAEQVAAIEHILSFYGYNPGTKRYLQYRDNLVFQTLNKATGVIEQATARGFTFNQ